MRVRHFHHTFLVAWLVMAVACRGERVSHRGQDDGSSELASTQVQSVSGDATASASNKDDGKSRPSEDGEGVPGYLSNVFKVLIKKTGTTLNISAPAGTVAAARPEKQVLFVFQVDERVGKATSALTLAGAADTERGQALIGRILGGIAPNADGSFAADFSTAADGAILVRIGGDFNDTKIVISDFKDDEKIQVIYKDLSNGEAPKRLSEEVYDSLFKKGFERTTAANQIAAEVKSRAACNSRGFFWSEDDTECDGDKQIIRLQYCVPEPDVARLKELIASKNHAEKDLVLSYINDDLTDGYRLDQCYTWPGNKGAIIISLLKIQILGTREYRSTDETSLPLSLFKEHILP